VPCIRGWEEVGWWRGWVGELTMPSDTDDQVVFTVGQTDGHSSPDHTMSCAEVATMEQNLTTSYPINVPQGPHWVYYCPL